MDSNLTKSKKFHIVNTAVAHDMFKLFSNNAWQELLEKNGKIIYFKGIVPKEINPIRLY